MTTITYINCPTNFKIIHLINQHLYTSFLGGSFVAPLWVLKGYSVGPWWARCVSSSGPLRVLGGYSVGPPRVRRGNLVPKVSLFPAPKSGKKRDPGNEVA